MADLKITDNLRAILDNCEFTPNGVKLPDGQLDRATYVKINKLLESAGGKWSKKLKIHVFEGDPKEKLGLLAKQEVLIDQKRAAQKFYTPQWLVEKIVEMAEVKGKTVREPSCGDGRVMRECIRQGAKEVTGVDILPENCEGLNVIVADFLTLPVDEQVDIIVGNPPFSRTDWLKHTLHAYKFVKEKLVFILPNSIHSNKKFQDFVIDKQWEYEEIEAGEFKESRTMIATNIVTIYK